MSDTNIANTANTSAQSGAISARISSSSNYTPDQVLAGVKANMTSSKRVNSQSHINTQTQAPNVNVYQVATGFFAYTSSMSIDTDGSDPDPDPDHQDQTTWQDDNGNSLGAHHVPYYVLGDICYDGQSPCKWFYYAEHNITGLQFATDLVQRPVHWRRVRRYARPSGGRRAGARRSLREVSPTARDPQQRNHRWRR